MLADELKRFCGAFAVFEPSSIQFPFLSIGHHVNNINQTAAGFLYGKTVNCSVFHNLAIFNRWFFRKEIAKWNIRFFAYFFCLIKSGNFFTGFPYLKKPFKRSAVVEEKWL